MAAGSRSSARVEKIRLLSERPADEPDTDAGIADRLEFPRQPRLVAVLAADETKPTGVGDSSGQRTATDAGHRDRQDRMLDAEQCRDRGVKRH